MFLMWYCNRPILTNPAAHMSHIPQCTIQNRNVHISVLNGALWDMGQVHCGISKLSLFAEVLQINNVHVFSKSILSYFSSCNITEFS